MHDGKRSERLAQAGHSGHSAHDVSSAHDLNAEDVLHPSLLEDDLVDREYLTTVFREPSRYLPPPRVRRRPEPTDPPEPESALARRSKLIALVIAAILLLGSIVAAALLTERQDTGMRAVDGKLEITGAAALGGFVIPDPERTGTPSESAAGSNAVGGPESTADRSGDSTSAGAQDRRQAAQGNQAEGAPVPHSGAETSGTTSTTSEEKTAGTQLAAETVDPVSTVREFYQLVANRPTDALSLLDPVLVGDQTGDLVRAWSSMTSIEIEEIEDRGNGMVHAVVLMTQPDGRRLRVTQLLQLAEGPVAMIANATLVSARNT